MSSNTVDAALQRPPGEIVEALAALPEDQWFERKSARSKPKDLAVALVAMGNAEGGTIVVGLHDGRAETPTPQALNDLRQAPLDYTTPPVRTHFSEVAHPDGALFVARVHPSGSVHEHVNGACYLRVGDESRKLTFAQRQELHDDRGESHFDGKPLPGLTVEDLDEEQVEQFRQATGSRTDGQHVLRARGLLGRHGEVTVAAWLLFAELPQTEMPHAHVRVLKYTENERGSGAGLTLDDAGDRRVEGSVPRMIQGAAELIDRWAPKRRALGPDGRFSGVPLVPRGLRPPVYRQSSGAVHLTLSALRSIDDDVLASLPRGAESLLDVLRTAGRPLSTGEIIDAVGSSRPTVTKQLQALREHGLAHWTGKSPRDPRATWSLP